MERQVTLKDFSVFQLQLEMDRGKAVMARNDFAKMNIDDWIRLELFAHPADPARVIVVDAVV